MLSEAWGNDAAGLSLFSFVFVRLCGAPHDDLAGPLAVQRRVREARRMLIARLSPYAREHIHRFGRYVLDMDDLLKSINPQSLPFEIAL
jgi:hypothetical protein